MNKVLLTASVLASAVVLASAANAADMAPAGYDWTGFYAGVNAGAAWNNSEVDQDYKWDGTRVNELQNQIEGDQTVFTGGFNLGYNYQMDQIVLGVETDINYLGFSDDNKRGREFGDITYNSVTYHDVTANSKTSFSGDWYGTLRGRLGFAADNLLFYGTGGLAYGHMSADGQVKFDSVEGSAKWDGSTDSTNFGWTAGAGMEYGLDRWTLGVEYLFVDLGSAEWDGDNNLPNNIVDKSDAKGSVDYQFSVVRATAKLRF